MALKYSEGLTRFWASVTGVTIALVSLFLLTLSLQRLPAGTAYAVWVGIGACGVVIAGIAVFGESASLLRLCLLALILAGIIGLKLVEG
jgi:quaternary ammonium compound-resistance protein SugE